MSEESKQHRSNLEENIFIYLGLTTLLVFIAWYLAGEHIARGMIYLLRAETHALYSLLNTMGYHSESLGQLLINIDSYDMTEKVGPGKLLEMVAFVETNTKYFFIVPFAILVWVMTFIKRQSYNRVFNGNSFIKMMSKPFPRIRPIVHLDFGQSDKERGAFTYALSPFEWAKERGVLQDMKHPGKTKDTFDPAKCRKEIINDIESDVFKGASPEQMDLPRRFIFAVYGLWYMQKYKEHNELLDEAAKWFIVRSQKQVKLRRVMDMFLTKPVNKIINTTELSINKALKHLPKDISVKLPKLMLNTSKYQWTVPQEWLIKINQYCKEAEKNRRVKRITERHVFQDTVLKGMMDPIPKTTAAYYIWLKAINKNLYYTMHQTGLEVPFALVKGISYIYDKEVKLGHKGERLVSKDEQGKLSKKEILSRINFDNCVSDLYWSIERTGFMHQEDLLEYSNEELANMMRSKSDIKQIDMERPIWMFYETSGKGSTGRTIKSISFYDPQSHETMKEFSTPQGQLNEDDKALLEWYMTNNYIHVFDIEYVKKWLNARGINDEMVMYDMLWDAQDAYDQNNLTDAYKVEQWLGLTVQDIIERNEKAEVKTFVPMDVRVKEVFQRIQSELLLKYQ